MEGWVAFGLSCYRLFPVSWFLDIDEKFEIAQRECAVDGPGIINPGLVAIEYRVELEFLRVSDADIGINYILCLFVILLMECWTKHKFSFVISKWVPYWPGEITGAPFTDID